MPVLLSDLSAWRDHEPPVRVGPAVPGTITVRQLATGRGYEVVASAPGPELSRRSAQLKALHLANWAITELLIRPVFADRTWIAAGPHQLGFRLGPGGSTPELWLAPQAPAVSCPGAPAIGTAIGGLLAPVARVVAQCSRIHQRAVTTIAAESAIAGLYRAARSAGHSEDPGWLEDTSDAIARALGARVTAQRLNCSPDDGPAVVLPARSLCCVLNPRTSSHSCPGCPKVGSTPDQTRDATQWLSGMDDQEFRDTAGRPRLHPAAARARPVTSGH